MRPKNSSLLKSYNSQLWSRDQKFFSNTEIKNIKKKNEISDVLYVQFQGDLTIYYIMLQSDICLS